MKIAVQSLTDEIAELEALLRDESIASPRYGVDAIGGGGELTATEAAAARRVRIKEQVGVLQRRIASMERRIRAIDRALDTLPLVDGAIVRGRINGLSWVQIGERAGFTERGARKRHSRAMKDIGLMLFGVA